MNQTRALATRPATAVVAKASAGGLPRYVSRDQARAIINAADTTTHRLLLETLWQSGGRVSEVLHLRPCDVDGAENAVHLWNLKQSSSRARKVVYVSPDLIAALKALARDARLGQTECYFRSAKSGNAPMSRQQAWTIITRCARHAGVYLPTSDGRESPATGRDFRHGAAIHQLRYGIPLSEVQQQLGHARIDTTTVYTRLTNAERRAYADRVEW